MVRLFVATVVLMLTWLPATGWAEEVSKEQIKPSSGPGSISKGTIG